MTDRLLIDNSVWQRQHHPVVAGATEALLDPGNAAVIVMCPPIAAEAGFSARSPGGQRDLMVFFADFPDCSVHPSSTLTMQVQHDVFAAGLFRAVGALDTVIAAYAIANDAVVVHYDRDFELIATVRPDLRHRWIVPRRTPGI